MQNTTLFCFWASYLVAWVLELIRTRKDGVPIRIAGWVLTAAGLVAHTIYLFVRANRSDLAPLIGSAHDWLLVLAWIPVAVIVVTGIFSRASFAVYFLAPVLVVVSAAPFVYDAPSVSVADGKAPSQYWLSLVHAGMLAIGAAGILLAAALSAMYLIQHYRLKQRKVISPGARPMSLERVARLNWWAIAVSVPMLTTGLALGVVLVIGSWATENPVPLSEPPFIGVAVLWLLGMPLFIGLLRTKQGGGRSVAWRTGLASGFLIGSLLLGTLLTSGDSTLHGPKPAIGEDPADDQTSSEQAAGEGES